MVGVEALLVNAVWALPLAALAWLTSRVFKRRPSLSHALWLLVLLKLITPPLWELPLLGARADYWPSSLGSVDQADSRQTPLATMTPNEISYHAGNLAESDEIGFDFQEPATFDANEIQMRPRSRVESTDAWRRSRTLAIWIWLLGSAHVGAIAVNRIRRFRRALRAASNPSPALFRRLRRISDSMGLERPPRLLCLEARLSPMLFGVGPWTTLLIPAGLERKLRANELEALLLHELAHYQRRDHWVRVVELVVGIVFWWHPVLWWARRELRRAEEAACDAWVVSARPALRKAYARALIRCVDYVAGVAQPVPPVASPLGDAGFLLKRVEIIMQKQTSKRLSWLTRMGLVALALFVLPLLPTFAQDLSTEEAQLAELIELEERELPEPPEPQEHQALREAQELKNLASARASLRLAKQQQSQSNLPQEIRIEKAVIKRLKRVMRRAPSAPLKHEIAACADRLDALVIKRAILRRSNPRRGRAKMDELHAKLAQISAEEATLQDYLRLQELGRREIDKRKEELELRQMTLQQLRRDLNLRAEEYQNLRQAKEQLALDRLALIERHELKSRRKNSSDRPGVWELKLRECLEGGTYEFKLKKKSRTKQLPGSKRASKTGLAPTPPQNPSPSRPAGKPIKAKGGAKTLPMLGC
ncbi:MAG: M56 family metallopeptidase [Planctomycetota bacterium]